jgi:hypothetical protein
MQDKAFSLNLVLKYASSTSVHVSIAELDCSKLDQLCQTKA